MKPNRIFKKKPNQGGWLSRLKGNGGGNQPANQQQQMQQPLQGGNQQQQQQQLQTTVDWNGFWQAPDNAQNGKASLMRNPFNVDATKIRDVAKGQNFAMQIQPEVLQKVLGGDVNALAQIFDSFGKAMYARTIHDTMGVVNSGFDQFSQSVEGYLPSQLQDHSFKQNLRSQFEQAKDPMFEHMFNSVAEQMKLKNPNWSDDQIFGGVKEYFTKMGVDFDAKMKAEQSQEQQQQQQAGETDWADFGGFVADGMSGDQSSGSNGGNNMMGGNQQGNISTGAAPVSFNQ